MSSLKEIRARINSVASTEKITNAMKMVSAAKLKKTESATMSFLPYRDKLSEALSNYLSALDENVSIPLAEQREVKRVAIIAFASDSGLCGVYNANASKLFQKDGNKNVLLPEHQDKIMELFANRKDEQYLARLVKNDDILENDCNLSVSSYVEQEDTREIINIDEVNANLESLITKGTELNKKIEAIIKELGE